MTSIATTNTSTIKRIASELGFDFCGISKAERLTSEERNLTNWLNKGYHGAMSYMENHFDKRLDPTLLVPGAKSVVSLLLNYYPENSYDQDSYKISKYAYGVDYHFIIKDKLKNFIHRITEEIGGVGGRVFVDSAPVLDRAWAAKSGLGWIGKNSMLITKQKGSFYFISELIIDLDLEADTATTDHCGTCTACLDACPTDAIIADKVIDSNKCISYLTIELRDQIPSHFKQHMEGWVFGCDICQDVCPWNRFAAPHSTKELKEHPQLKGLQQEEWTELTEQVFKDVFKKSAIKRAGYLKLKENIQFCKDE
jgi:epoxyqueuosine reductase